MINLLQKHRRDDYEDFTIGNMIWHTLLFYRPQKELNIPWADRRAATLSFISTLLPFYKADHPHRAEIIHKAVKLCFEQEVLGYLLRTTKGYIDLDLSISSTVHEALHRRLLERDPSSMRLIVQKTKDLHRCEIKYDGRTVVETPTMLAMYDMKTFIAWRELLHDLGHETSAFVEQELKEGALRDDVWTRSSLSELFDTEGLPDPIYGPMFFGFPNCERCGHNGSIDFGKLKVDLIWRRHLWDIRVKLSDKMVQTGNASTASPIENTPPMEDPPTPGTKDSQEDAPPSETRNTIVEQEANFKARRSLPYRIVCSDACRDGVCVAWVYEDNSNDEPDLPLYPFESPSKSEDNSENGVAEESCLTDCMPGAFRD
jgi:hypothetical protein